jgi:hypothetical protein
MKKQLMIGLMALGMAVLFSGCSYKINACKIENEGHPVSQTGNFYMVEGQADGMSISHGQNTKTRNLHGLQNAATLTLERGYKYFAIKFPQGEASNIDGSLINTAEEFIERCLPNPADILNMGRAKCGMPAGNRNIKLGIYVFNEEQPDVMTYNAQDVKDYLVANKLWRERGIDAYYEKCTIQLLRR